MVIGLNQEYCLFSLYSMIIQIQCKSNPERTIVGNIDSHFNNLPSGSHLKSIKFNGILSVD